MILTSTTKQEMSMSAEEYQELIREALQELQYFRGD